MAAKPPLPFYVAFLLILLGAAAQFKVQEAIGIGPSFTLATLITLAFFIGFVEFLLAVGVGTWILNWQPTIGWELVVFAAISFALFGARRFLPWQSWFSNFIVVAVGVLLFYLLSSPSFLREGAAVFLRDEALSVVWAGAAFVLLRRFYSLSFRSHRP